ncbi:hypothetical protein [Flexivirga sp. B27]
MRTTELSPDVAAVVDRLTAAYDLFQLEAEVGERLRRPSPAVRDALCESGVFKLIMPRELGGLEATPTEVLDVIESLSYADASLGWLARSIVTETALAATYLPQAAIDEFRADGFPLVSGHATSYTGTTKEADGGYLVTGTWHFAPGTSVATHLNLSVTSADGEPLVCLVPRSDVWLADNWDMLGLRATASLDYSVKDLFVPERMTFRIQPGKALRGGESSHLSPALLAGLHQSAWSQGVGRRMLEELRALAQRRDPAQGAPVTTDDFFAEFARHYSHVRGTMALMRETWSGIATELGSARSLTDEQETMARLASSLATRTALEIAQLVHRFAGAQVMRKSAIQRFFRDSHAGNLHRGASTVVTTQCGRMLTETLPEGTHWGFFDLATPDPMLAQG